MQCYAFELEHNKTDKDLCAQRRLRSAWASAQSGQSIRCTPDEDLGPNLPIMRTGNTHLSALDAEQDNLIKIKKALQRWNNPKILLKFLPVRRKSNKV